MVNATAGERVRLWLKENKQTQAWLANQLHVARESVWRWLEGQRAPGAHHAGRMAEITGVEASAWPINKRKAA